MPSLTADIKMVEAHGIALKLRSMHAQAIFEDEGTSRDDRLAQVAVFDDIARMARRVLGAAHPLQGNS
jgi:hypothetical protein